MGAFPQIVDWNEDGNKDLLVGDALGSVTIFMNTNTNANPVLTNSGHLQVGGIDLNVGGKATPVVNDWNEDGKKDLVIGEEDGRLVLLINTGANGNPVFSTIQYVRANGHDLDVGNTPEDRSSPEIADLDDDGFKDLIIGQFDGMLYFYANSGTNAAPVFTGSVLLQASGHPIDLGGYSRPEIIDWDEDGDLDLLTGDEMAYVTLFRNPATIYIDEKQISGAIPSDFTLSQNYPNPFNPDTKIRFAIPRSNKVGVEIYNVQGQLVSQLGEKRLAAGWHEVNWRADDQPSGVYFAVVRFGGYSKCIKMWLLK
jgi:hypothetical protein